MRHHRTVLVCVTSSFLLGLVACANGSRTSSPAPPPTSQTAQAPKITAQPPTGGKQEPGSGQPSPGTVPPSTEGELGPAVQGEPPVGEIQERGVPLKPLPGTTAPPPAGMAPPPCGAGLPTENIAKVACAFQVKAKSLTILVVANPGPTPTQPVTISILLGGYAPKRITQTYVASTGNHFLNNDPEGDGKPRSARVDITLTEPNPAGGVYTYTIPGSVMLDPLYDVNISPLDFTLFTPCDQLPGIPVEHDAEIRLNWTSPDHKHNEVKFNTRSGKNTTVSAFAWARPEVSASANLNGNLDIYFWEYDFRGPHSFPPGYAPPSLVNLVPGVTRQVVTKLTEAFGDCTASVQYNITYTLRFYPFL